MWFSQHGIYEEEKKKERKEKYSSLHLLYWQRQSYIGDRLIMAGVDSEAHCTGEGERRHGEQSHGTCVGKGNSRLRAVKCIPLSTPTQLTWAAQ